MAFLSRGPSQQLGGGSSAQAGGGGGGEAAPLPKRQRLEEIPDGGLIFEARDGISVDPDALKLIKEAARKMFLAKNFMGPDQTEHRYNTVSVKIDKRKLDFLVSLSYRRRSVQILEATQQCTGDEVEPAPPLSRLPPLPAVPGFAGSSVPVPGGPSVPAPEGPAEESHPWPPRAAAMSTASSSASAPPDLVSLVESTLNSVVSIANTMTLGQGQSLEITNHGAELIQDTQLIQD